MIWTVTSCDCILIATAATPQNHENKRSDPPDISSSAKHGKESWPRRPFPVIFIVGDEVHLDKRASFLLVSVMRPSVESSSALCVGGELHVEQHEAR